ncbi:MAG: hypothetical protein SFU25_06560 [Candidatus Caenarcaniphilales bacterium]|nr:hypothetical protein [Candidatus Caenarcaniphilales bacterium]
MNIQAHKAYFLPLLLILNLMCLQSSNAELTEKKSIYRECKSCKLNHDKITREHKHLPSPNQKIQEQYLKTQVNTTKEKPSGSCKRGGCSGHLCIEAGNEGISTCEWREEYACYRNATCDRQANGLCGWTMDEDLKGCLTGKRGRNF